MTPRVPDLARRRESARQEFQQGAEAARDPRHSAEYTRELLGPLGERWAAEVAKLSAEIGAARRSLETERADMFAKANAPLGAADGPGVTAIYGMAGALAAPEPRGDVARRAIDNGDTFTLRVLLQSPPSLDLLTTGARQDAEEGLLRAVDGERYDLLQEERRELERLAGTLERDSLEAYSARLAVADGPGDRAAIEAASVEALLAANGIGG